MNSSNRVLGLITLAAGVAVWVLCAGIPTVADAHTLSPGFFPQLLSIVLALLGLCLFWQGKGQVFSIVWHTVTSSRNLCLVAATLGYTLAFGYMDYRLISPLYIAAVLWIQGSRKPLEFVFVPLGATAVLYVLFRYGFQVLLPEMG